MMAPALAMAIGVMVDRYAGQIGSMTWAIVALAGASATLVLAWRGRTTLIGLVIAFTAIGGGWHHVRWSDLAADDLARSITSDAEPRPAWLRGVRRRDARLSARP